MLPDVGPTCLRRALAALTALILLAAPASQAHGAEPTSPMGDGSEASILERPDGVAPLALPALGFLIADRGNAVVRQVDVEGRARIVAGTLDVPGDSGDGGPATAAQLTSPVSVSPTRGGGFLIADRDAHRVRRVDPQGTITTVAGTGVTDVLDAPTDAVERPDGSILIADSGSHRILELTVMGVLRPIAGTGTPTWSGDGGAAQDAGLSSPQDVALLADGGFLIADSDNDRVRQVSATGTITTIAGGGAPSNGDGEGGPATDAELRHPVGVAALRDSGVLIAEESGHRVRRVKPDGIIVTDVGDGFAGNSGGSGAPFEGRVNEPQDVGVSPHHGYLIADSGNHRILFVNSGDKPAVDPPEGDVTPPGAPSVTKAPQSTGSATTVSWEFAVEPGATAQCRLSHGGAPLADWDGCAAAATYDLDGRSDGSYDFEVRAVDPAGNVGEPARGSYVLDRAAPAAPVLTSSPPPVGSATAATWAFAGEDGASFECHLTHDTAGEPAWAPCTSPQTFPIDGPDGAYHFAVRAVDAAGNVGGAVDSVYTLDRTAPAAPVLTGAPPPAGANRSPAWSFSAAGDRTECRLKRAAVVIAAWTGCEGSVTYHLGSEVDGSYTFAVRAIDAVGNVGPAASGTYRFDRTAPAPPTLTSTPPAAGEAAKVTWAFAAEDGARFECLLTRNQADQGPWVPCTSPRTYELAGPNGRYHFFVRALDPVGNASARTASEYRLEHPAPPKPTDAPAPAPASTPAAVPAPAPAPDVAEPLPAATEPELGRSAVAGTVKGAVQVRIPGSERYVTLDGAADIPIGAVVDATKGEVRLQTALDANGRTQSATFSGGAFEIKQDPRANGRVDLHLRGGVSRAGCRATSRASSSPLAAASAKKKRKKSKRVLRSLWGEDDGGRYRTHGQDSVANVRGTRWLTQDRCDGTLTRVTEGAVEVRSKRGRRRTVLVRAGRSFLARRPA